MRSLLIKFGIFLLVAFFVYSRFVNLGWGLPYPMHPDERNMADAITRLTCLDYGTILRELFGAMSAHSTLLKNTSCSNPHFFAYGQFTLYAAYLLSKYIGINANSFVSAVLALRTIAALSSIVTAIFACKILHELAREYKIKISKLAYLPVCFYPAAIAYAHYGTTESILSMLFVIACHIGLQALNGRASLRRYSWISALLVGAAIATKFSAITYVSIYLYVVALKLYDDVFLYVAKIGQILESRVYLSQVLHKIILGKLTFLIRKYAVATILFIIATLIVVVLGSPYNFIASREFLGSINYESMVGYGSYIPFYTRQFILETPLLFQLTRVYPFTLGHLTFVFFMLSFVVIGYQNKKINFLRFAMLATILPNIFLYAKWTRFVSAPFGIQVVFAVLAAYIISSKLLGKYATKTVVVIMVLCALPGLAYMSVYTSLDTRFAASSWIYKNVRNGQYILQETANVVDLPVPSPESGVMAPAGYNLTGVPFNFYELDIQPQLQKDLQVAIARADYIVVPSRRIFYNHTCLRPAGLRSAHSPAKCKYLESKYPQVNAYYKMLFDPSKYSEVAKFVSHPKIKIFGKTIFEARDEDAEETFTVFDHPVIRVYKKV